MTRILGDDPQSKSKDTSQSMDATESIDVSMWNHCDYTSYNPAKPERKTSTDIIQALTYQVEMFTTST